MLPRKGDNTNSWEHTAGVYRGVCGNGGCFDTRADVFVCLTPTGLDSWVAEWRRLLVALSGLRGGHESALRLAWETIVVPYQWSYQWRLWATCQMSIELWPVWGESWSHNGVILGCYGHMRGLDQTVCAQGIKGELSELALQMCRNGIPPLGDSKTMMMVMMMMKTDTNRLELWLGFIPEYPFDQYTGLPYVWSTGNNHIH